MTNSPTLEDIYPAVLELDAELLNQNTPFDPDTIEETASEIATTHNIDKEILLEHFTTILFLTHPDKNDDPEDYAQLLEYLEQRETSS